MGDLRYGNGTTKVFCVEKNSSVNTIYLSSLPFDKPRLHSCFTTVTLSHYFKLSLISNYMFRLKLVIFRFVKLQLSHYTFSVQIILYYNHQSV